MAVAKALGICPSTVARRLHFGPAAEVSVRLRAFSEPPGEHVHWGATRGDAFLAHLAAFHAFGVRKRL